CCRKIHKFKILPSGHTIGSSSLILYDFEDKNPVDVFITGEFRPEIGQIGEFLSPRKCRTLVTELTFTNPEVIFPPIPMESKRLTDWLEDNLTRNPVVLYAYQYGKAQELSMIIQQEGLDKIYPVIFDLEAYKINEYCQSIGYEMAHQLTKKKSRSKKIQKEKNFILIVPRSEKFSSPVMNLRKKRLIKDAEVSGWCMYPEWRGENPADEYFVISDHPDYNTTQDFIKKCHPERVIYLNQ
ncbi:MAG: hypothetical protein ACTSWY_14520, partial [Promethearchaeota archaeon]